ncbi:MAG: lipopolysaccharide core heptose(I) kinase RfaP [Alcanivorax sp.]|uniref:Lipopolysaccharide core heptose(I) kinase n=1 Tax=Alloalcanivorax marinus TaxID=1177169 RepID=A0A9Q3YMM0_9GAMM|nr:lipopolysaccharide core heptose(I) kinase RfaP [Alloalcanivorax marinus]MBM7335391.1 lipopolysaccharide core heptose(I) kinase RfaP [Alloalcanivorax marinus]MCC4308927.1 lipopolysaccharide core heptose(I) kinase RfaP [Alloalcanivorax marinus]MCU5785893.1 lipopolysaccharide core heptose(I) kinase RfaP [Alloalcanivorax marinus]
MTLYLREDLARAWRGLDPLEQAARQDGDVFRAREGRRTLRFIAEGRHYFLKYHGGVGWKEIIKNLTQGKLPVLGALSEVRAIHAVQAAGIDTLSIAGYGERGANPARRRSFLVTDELMHTVSLEELGEHWRLHPGPAPFKWALIRRVGEIAKAMHDAGVNHRDFYLGHFLIARSAVDRHDATAPLHLIDLHRSQVRARVPRRWRTKDIGGLYFSTARLDLTHRDLLRFVRAYTDMPLREALADKARLLDAARREAEGIYQRYFEKTPTFPLRFSEHPGKDI